MSLLYVVDTMAILGVVFGSLAWMKYIDSTKKIEGTLKEVQISKEGRGKQWHPDWLPMPGFDGSNYHDMPSYTILTLELPNGRFYKCALHPSDKSEPFPPIGSLVWVEVSRGGVYRPLMGDEPRFRDGTPSLNWCKSLPVIKTLESILR